MELHEGDNPMTLHTAMPGFFKFIMKRLYQTILLLACLASFPAALNAQERLSNGLVIDKTVHDFGDILLDSGPVSCTFSVKNDSDKPAVIYSVTSSCGCTDVKWTREPIRPGAVGKISATYSNDEGPYPFDKSLTVYFSDVKKPVVLKLRGNSMAKKLPLSELYPVKFGVAALKSAEIKAGNLEQGGVKSSSAKIANLSQKPIRISFSDMTPELSIQVSPNPIPAGETADMNFVIRASREKWGKNWYDATIVVDGKPQGGKVSFWAFTKENFDSLTKEEKARGARPMFTESTFSFGKVKKGSKVDAVFEVRNDGKEDFRIYKMDADCKGLSWEAVPVLSPGGTMLIKMTLDTSYMPVGESLAIITLTTNSPLRPIVNLFIAGWLE